MNERIKELMVEAKRWADELPTERILLLTQWQDEWRVKFAELVAMETWKVIVKSQRGHMNPTSALDAVKQHFGVEE
jgi:hypothetical protein